MSKELERIEQIIEKQLKKDSTQTYTYDLILDECDKMEEQLAELKTKLEEVEEQYAYECECNKQFVECQNENEQLKAENERLLKREDELCRKINLYKYNKKEYDRIFEKHIQQLKEKDKTIEVLISARQNDENFYTKQVCEKIRNFIHTKEYDNFGVEYLMDGNAVLEFLDQIEKGENNE